MKKGRQELDRAPLAYYQQYYVPGDYRRGSYSTQIFPSHTHNVRGANQAFFSDKLIYYSRRTQNCK